MDGLGHWSAGFALCANPEQAVQHNERTPRYRCAGFEQIELEGCERCELGLGKNLHCFRPPPHRGEVARRGEDIASIVALARKHNAVPRPGMELGHAGGDVFAGLFHERFRGCPGREGAALRFQHLGDCEDHQAKNDFTRS